MEKYFSKSHEWVKTNDADEAIVGISSFAAKELGDITYVEFTKDAGDDIIVGDVIASIESVKAASDVYSPLSGTIIAVNHNLDDDPAVVNSSAEEKGWLYKLENIDPAELDDLMDEATYQEFLKTL